VLTNGCGYTSNDICNPPSELVLDETIGKGTKHDTKLDESSPQTLPFSRQDQLTIVQFPERDAKELSVSLQHGR